MDDRIAFDVYATMRDPHFRVEEIEESERLDIIFGGPNGPEPEEMLNVLHLMFTHPTTVIDLGRELFYRGVRWHARRTLDEAYARDCPEDYPVPRPTSPTATPHATGSAPAPGAASGLDSGGSADV